MAIQGLQSPNSAWNENTETNLAEQRSAGTASQDPVQDPAADPSAIAFADSEAVSNAKPSQIFFGDANPLESGVESDTQAGGEPQSTSELLKDLIELMQSLLRLLGIAPPASDGASDSGVGDSAPEKPSGASPGKSGGADALSDASPSSSAAEPETSAAKASDAGNSSGAQARDTGSAADSESGSVSDGDALSQTPVAGEAASTINDSDFSAGLTQTPGGKEIKDGPNEGQKLHRTGLSSYENNNGVESFGAAPGGELSGSSNTPRSEAYYSGDTAGKSFAADYKVDVEGDTTIFQMKDNSGGSPAFRVSVNDEGDVVVNNGDGSPEKLGQIAPGEEFRLSVTDNGDGTASFGLNDTSGASLGEKTVAQTNDIESSQFRYGNYTQGEGKGSAANVTVANVETNI